MRPSLIATAGTLGVLVADSNRMQAQLLTNALRRRQEFRLIICGMDADSIEKAVASAAAQVALLSPHTSAGFAECIATLKQFHLAHPEIVKILLVESWEREMVVGAFRSGARGLFCLSQANLRLLRKCIHSVARGQIWANTEQINYVLELIAEVPQLRLVDSRGGSLLSPREEQVVGLVAEGLGNREIALELSLSEHTVKKYLFRIFDKLGISTRVELVLYAVHHGNDRHERWLSSQVSHRRPAMSQPL